MASLTIRDLNKSFGNVPVLKGIDLEVKTGEFVVLVGPLSNLDAQLRVEMRTEIKKLYQRLGKTTIYVTHDQVEAMTLASRIAVMHQGRLQQFAEPRRVYDRPANMFVAGFMGSPPMN